jgi:hypothetical protein
MARAERRRFIEEKEFRPRVRCHRRAPYFPILQRARDPSPALREAHDAPVIVVQNAAVPAQQTAAGECQDFAERRDAILQRHCTI